jgi:hypothetical protein
VDIGVLTVVCVVLAGLAVHAVMRAVRLRHEPEGRTLRAWWAAVLVVLAFVALLVEVGHHRREALVTDAMAAVTDNPRARADCERFTPSLLNLSQYDGYVWHDKPDVAEYRRHVCLNLAAYAGSSKVDPPLEQVAAVVLVAHETMHVNGIWTEADAECRAVQLGHLVAMRLGATEAQARALAARYFAEIYPHQRSDYVSGDCSEGGSLDIFPERAEFP